MVVYYLSIFNTNKIFVASFHLQIWVPQNSILPTAWVGTRMPKIWNKEIMMADLSETTVKASNKVFNSLCVPDRYYITQAIIELQFIRCIQVDTIYKSRKSDHIPVSLRMSEEEPFKRFNTKLQHNVRMNTHTSLSSFKWCSQ